MKLIDVTNSHIELVTRQLENTDSQVVRVYSLGASTVIFSQAKTHYNIIIVNKNRPIRDKEINFTVDKLFPQCQLHDLEVIRSHNFIEIELKP